MRILHVPFCYFPDPPGGTEVYVRSLARRLADTGHQIAVVAPGHVSESFTLDGTSVFKFAVDSNQSREVQYGGDDSAPYFRAILDTWGPDIVHLHALTSVVGPQFVDAAHSAGASVVFTYHTPTATCQRGTLIEQGRTVCNGRLEVRRCTACVLQAGGLPTRLADLASGIPGAGSRLALRLPIGSIGTALGMPYLIGLRHELVRRFLAGVDHIVVVAGWIIPVLEANGVPAEKMTVIRHGLDASWGAAAPEQGTPRRASLPLRIVLLGRLAPEKGIEVLLEALRIVPELPVSLDVYGTIQSPSDRRCARHLHRLAVTDPRVSFHDPVPNEDVQALLTKYDLLAVPSTAMETGPLVVLEAFGAGTPVLGSRLGGIAELVQDGINGILVAPASAIDWAQALRRVVEETELLPTLRRGMSPPRSMSDVAQDMVMVYERLRARTRTSVPTAAF